jgi:sugar phosphate isomerase/epimerase
MTDRREFLFGVAASLAAPALAAGPKMQMGLNTGNLGIKATLEQQIDYAARYGFEAVDPNIAELAALSESGMSRALDRLAAAKLTFGAVFQGVPISQPDEMFAAFLRGNLTTWARAMQRARMTRFATWINPCDRNLTYLQNFRLHARRIRDAAAVLAGHGISFGLEYVGPKTSWAAARYPFIHNMATLKELIAEVARPNVGFLLDSWHWYTAGDTVDDILSLRAADVVLVHLNDAPKDVPVEQQDDRRRESPCATGVIDMAGFINAVNRIGYDGPALSDPMNAELRKLPPDEALARTAEALGKAFTLIR